MRTKEEIQTELKPVSDEYLKARKAWEEKPESLFHDSPDVEALRQKQSDLLGELWEHYP